MDLLPKVRLSDGIAVNMSFFQVHINEIASNYAKFVRLLNWSTRVHTYTHTHTHTRARARTHTHKDARAQTHTHELRACIHTDNSLRALPWLQNSSSNKPQPPDMSPVWLGLFPRSCSCVSCHLLSAGLTGRLCLSVNTFYSYHLLPSFLTKTDFF